MSDFFGRLEEEFRRALATGLSPEEATSHAVAHSKEVLQALLKEERGKCELLVSREDSDRARAAADEAVKALGRAPEDAGARGRAGELLEHHARLASTHAGQQTWLWNEAQVASGEAFARFKAERAEHENVLQDFNRQVDRNHEYFTEVRQRIQKAFAAVPPEQWESNEILKAQVKAVEAEMVERDSREALERESRKNELTALKQSALCLAEVAGEFARLAREAEVVAQEATLRYESLCFPHPPKAPPTPFG